jgi:dTDP-4-dehydrorhamnose reductase
VDITQPPEVIAAALPPSVTAIINAAAYTDVDGAEDPDNRDKAVLVNTRGPGNLRLAFAGWLIHLSTGYVFSGYNGPYGEDEVPSPLNFYGMTKLGGEAAAAIRTPTLVVRTLDLYGPGTKTDFVRRVRDRLELGLQVEAPTNQYVTPTYTPHLAEALLWLAGKASLLDVANQPLDPILNVCGDATMSRFTWCQTIAKFFGFDPALVVADDKPWGIAVRPLRGGLLVDRARNLGVPIYSPQEGLASLQESGRAEA